MCDILSEKNESTMPFSGFPPAPFSLSMEGIVTCYESLLEHIDPQTKIDKWISPIINQYILIKHV